MFVVGGGNYIEYQNLMDYAKVNGFCLCIRCVLSGFKCTNCGTAAKKLKSTDWPLIPETRWCKEISVWSK